MKSLLGIALAAAISLVAVIVAAVALQTSCGGGLPGVRGGAGPVPIEFRYQAPDTARIHRASFIPVQAAAPAPRQFSQSFICGVRMTDLVIAGFALFLILISVQQAFWLRRAVEAAEDSTRLVGSALIATQRAYVTFREFRVNVTRLSAIEDIQNATVQPVWENGGTTPARNGRSHVSWKYFTGKIPADVELADFDETGNRVVTDDKYLPLAIGPRGTANSPVIVVDGATIRNVRENQGRVLIWGWAEYDDVFEGSPRHRTEFCYQMNVTGSLSQSHIAFSLYKRFNGMDAECERYAGEPLLMAPPSPPPAPPPPPAPASTISRSDAPQAEASLRI
jgi:hypothetical protein